MDNEKLWWECQNGTINRYKCNREPGQAELD